MIKEQHIPVIIAGGSGSRLWPMSRSLYPKQFLALTGEMSLLQQTIERVMVHVESAMAPIIVCNKEHRFIVAEQCRELDIEPTAIILEPEGRNTAAAIALAAEYAIAHFSNPNLWVMPADHAIAAGEGLMKNFQVAAEAVAEEYLVTFGVVPTAPSTGYGYINADRSNADASFYPVKQFVEKPDLATAEQYVASGDFYWNSGMFAFNANVFLRELKAHASMIFENCHDAMANPSADEDFVRPDEAIFVLCPDTSVDYAVMEQSQKTAMVPLTVAWNDVGSWDALMQECDKDAEGNVLQGDVMTHHVANSYVHADHRLVTVAGLQDVVVVETADAVLVAKKSMSQDVKAIVDKLKFDMRKEVSEHVTVFRPWGSYTCIDEGEHYKVKRIVVDPKHALSLQRHKYRSEHWIVVKGTATVVNGDKEFDLEHDKSTYIPAGRKHRLANNTAEILEIIEVQTGDYLGEDDIERFSDQYGRVERAGD